LWAFCGWGKLCAEQLTKREVVVSYGHWVGGNWKQMIWKCGQKPHSVLVLHAADKEAKLMFIDTCPLGSNRSCTFAARFRS
jgi:hypothetical protein